MRDGGRSSAVGCWQACTARPQACIPCVAALPLNLCLNPLLLLPPPAQVLRLDGNPRAQLARGAPAPQADLSKKDGLGNVEEAVISKYAAADDEEGEEGSGDDE